jgi:hypothetical protein
MWEGALEERKWVWCFGFAVVKSMRLDESTKGAFRCIVQDFESITLTYKNAKQGKAGKSDRDQVTVNPARRHR